MTRTTAVGAGAGRRARGTPRSPGSGRSRGTPRPPPPGPAAPRPWGPGGAPAGGAPPGSLHYHNATYGVSITVDRRLTAWRTASAGGAFEVSFVDAAGAIVNGRHLDALTVSLVDTGATPPGQQAALTSALRALGTTMVGKLGTNAQVGTVSDVSLNGLTGVVVPYGVTVSGRPVVGWLYLLSGSGHIYALTAGATAAKWDTYRPIFYRAIGSFRAG